MSPTVLGQKRVSVVLGLFEVGQHALEVPADVAELVPVVVVVAVAPHVHHVVEHRRAAEHLPPGPVAALAIEGELY